MLAIWVAEEKLGEENSAPEGEVSYDEKAREHRDRVPDRIGLSAEEFEAFDDRVVRGEVSGSRPAGSPWTRSSPASTSLERDGSRRAAAPVGDRPGVALGLFHGFELLAHHRTWTHRCRWKKRFAQP